MLFQGHLSARECSGLVAAKDVNAAEVLHRLEMFDYHILARHVHRPAAQGYRCNHRQKLGGQTNGQSYRE